MPNSKELKRLAKRMRETDAKRAEELGILRRPPKKEGPRSVVSEEGKANIGKAQVEKWKKHRLRTGLAKGERIGRPNTKPEAVAVRAAEKEQETEA